MEHDESQIIARVQTGRLEDFAVLYDAYRDAIYRFIYFRTHHTQTAEDLTSAVFMKALEHVQSYRPGRGSFSAWLYRIARNSVIDHFRGLRPTEDLENAWDVAAAANVERDADIALAMEKVRAHIDRLTPQQREIILLRVWDGLSHREIADVLGISEANAKMIFSRTLSKLQKESLIATLALLVGAGLKL